MKSIHSTIFKTFLLIALMAFGMFQADAQTAVKQAGFDAQSGMVTLAEGDMENSYELSLTALEIPAAKAYKWSRGTSNNLVEFQYEEGNSHITMILHTDRTKAVWDKSQWQDYLRQLAPQIKKNLVAHTAASH